MCNRLLVYIFPEYSVLFLMLDAYQMKLEGWFRPDKNKPQSLLKAEDEFIKDFLRFRKYWRSAAKVETKSALQMCSILESKTVLSLLQHILLLYTDEKGSKRLEGGQQYF